MTTNLLPVLGDNIVSTSRFRGALKEHLNRVREGEVLTVTGANDEEPVAVVQRATLAALYKGAQRLLELEAELADLEVLASDPDAIEALRTAALQIQRGEGLTPDEVRRRLGRPPKGK